MTLRGTFTRFRNALTKKSIATTEAIDELLKEFLRQERHRLSRGGGNGKGTTSELLNRDRFARNKVREVRKRFKKRRHPQLQSDALLATFEPSQLLDGINPERSQKWVPPLQRSHDQKIEIDLQNFSFIDNPVEAIAALKRLSEAECTAIGARLHFKDNHCKDIGPYLVLGELWHFLSPFFVGGRMPASIQKVMEAVGLRKLMNMRLRAVRDLKDVWAFQVRSKRPYGEKQSPRRFLQPQRDQHVADDLCDEIDKWLGIPNPPFQITDEGRAWISNIILELLNNAERHSDPLNKNGGWSITAFMARRREGEKWVYRCHLGILSVGASIDESLNTCTPRLADQLDQYAAKHSRDFSRGTLRTVFALQDGVTRDPDADRRERGGVGFQSVMALIDMLGSTDVADRDPRMTIISGRSCIMLKQPYFKGVPAGPGPEEPRVIWFNAGNSPDVAPERLHVFDLPEVFSGTIISIAFTLDADYLSKRHVQKD